jgi:hypothetical protein
LLTQTTSKVSAAFLPLANRTGSRRIRTFACAKRAYPRETQEMVFDAHDKAFAFYGGEVGAQAPHGVGEGTHVHADERALFCSGWLRKTKGVRGRSAIFVAGHGPRQRRLGASRL